MSYTLAALLTALPVIAMGVLAAIRSDFPQQGARRDNQQT
jgi:cyanate permease